MWNPVLSKKKIVHFLLLIFGILTVIHIIFSTVAQRGLVFDGVWWFSRALDSFSSNNMFFENSWGHRPRGFINILNQIPMNFGYFAAHINSKMHLAHLFTLPLFLYPSLFLIFHYLLFRRSKRFDFLLGSIVLYGLIILPAQNWSIIEISLAASIWFFLFHYLCAKIDYSKFDIFIIVLLCAILYNSWEEAIILSPIVFFASLYYGSKETNKINKYTKYFIGLNSLLTAIFNIFFLAYFLGGETLYEIKRCIQDLFFYNNCIFFNNPYFILSVIAIIFTVSVCFRKKQSETKFLFSLFSVCFLFSLLVIIKPFNLYSMISSYSVCRNFIYIIFPVFLIVPLILDINKISIKRKFNSFLIVILTVSIVNTCLGIYISYMFDQERDYLKWYASSSKETIINPPEEFPSYRLKHANSFLWSTTYPYFTLVFCKKNECHGIYNYGDIAQGNNRVFYLKKDNENLFCTNIDDLSSQPILQCISIKNKFWDLSDIDKTAFQPL